MITGLQRVSRPGQRTYVDHAHIPRIQGGMGTAIISTSRGRHDRPRGPQRGRRRRGRGQGLVDRRASHVPNRKTTHPRPRRRDGRDRARARDRQRPQGRAVRARSTATSRSSSVDERDRRHAPDRPRRAPRAARPDPHAGGQHGPGRHRRLREAPGDPGRRLPRAAARPRPGAGARLLAPGVDQGAGRDRVRGARSRPGSSSAAPPSSRSARSPRYIRKQRKPEPYKGKGIRYEGEYVARKVGKRA